MSADRSIWGIFIVTFVFWIGISHAGTFVSAILRVFKAEFRRPFTRAAELMTTFGLAAGAMYPLIHLGRVWVFYWMIPYPNARWLWPNFRSPLVWDLLAITTYLLSQHDVPLLAAASPTWRWRATTPRAGAMRVYKTLALGWRGTEAEWLRLRKAIKIFAFAIIPVMFSVHTIVSWDFAVARWAAGIRPSLGRTSSSAPFSPGVSAVVTISIVLRVHAQEHELFHPPRALRCAGQAGADLLDGLGLFLLQRIPGPVVRRVRGDRHDAHLARHRPAAWVWYCMLICNVVIPWLTLWNKKIRRTPWIDVDHHPLDQRGHVLRALYDHPADPGTPALPL